MEPPFHLSPEAAARELLGWVIQSGECSGRIVETEAYSEHNDEACHTFFRRGAREFVEKHDAGAVYIYLNYGVHWLLNFLTIAPSGERGFVLIRALEPLTGLDTMHQRRTKKRPLQDHDLCSGPGKLTQALGIDSSDHEENILQSSPSFSIHPGEAPKEILIGPRIGISRATEHPWRFGCADNPHLSVRFGIKS